MKTSIRIGALAAIASLLVALAACVARPTWRGDEGAAYDVLNRSTIALLEIDRDALAGPLGSAMHHACAVFVFPGHVKGLPSPTATRADGVLLVRDRSTGHWSGPAFYALHSHDTIAGEHADHRGLVIAVGCAALRRLYADTTTDSPIELQDATPTDMTAWTLSSGHSYQASLDAMSLRPLPVISLAFYQAPASLAAITVDKSVRNDASAEIQSAIESVTK